MNKDSKISSLSNQNRQIHSNAERRRTLGIFYTPKKLARLLTHWGIRKKEDRILEPSFGGCVFLEASINRLRQLGSSDPIANLVGFDVDPSAFDSLSSLLSKPPSSRHFVQRNYLGVSQDDLPFAVDAVIANPPFVSYHQMTPEQRRTVLNWRRNNHPPFPNTASLWAYFLAQSISLISAGGRIAFVLPSTILTANYARLLLDDITKKFARVSVFPILEDVFADVGTKMPISVLLAEGYDPLLVRPPGRCSISSVPTLEEFESRLRIHQAKSENSVDDSRVIDEIQSHISTSRQHGNVCDLGDLVTVRIGEVVGDIPFFVNSREFWKQHGIPQRFLFPILSKNRQAPGIFLEEVEVKSNGTKVPLLFSVKAKTSVSSVKRYLSRYPTEQIHRNATFSRRKHWHLPPYDNSSKAFLSSISSNSPRLILNNARISCTNSLYKINPLPGGAKWNYAISVAVLTTITRLSTEIRARTFFRDAIKLEPSDVLALCIPTQYLSIHPNKAQALIRDTDSLIRSGERELAQQMADEELLIKPGIVSPKQLAKLQSLLSEIQQQRLRRI